MTNLNFSRSTRAMAVVVLAILVGGRASAAARPPEPDRPERTGSPTSAQAEDETSNGSPPDSSDSSDSSEDLAPLVLAQGEQRLLRFPGMKRFSLGSQVVRALPLPHPGKTAARDDLLLIKGIAPGSGDLWVWDKAGAVRHRMIRVERLQADELPQPLERALGKLQEAEVVIMGNGVILRGAVQSLGECARIDALARGFPNQVHDETTPTPALLKTADQRLAAAIRQLGKPGRFEVEKMGSALRVHGSVDRAGDKEATAQVFRTAYPKVVLDLGALPDDAPTVHFKVFLLELHRNRFGSLGLAWPDSQEGAFNVTTGAIQNQVSLDIALHAMEGDGSAKILSNPELVVRAPGEAELFAGGELPIKYRSQFYEEVSWKNYGLTLKLNVTHTTAERVRLDILTEVSHLDPSIAMNDVPGLQTNRMKTQVDARYGTPLLLSGLLQQGTREAAKGLPLLRNIPILGALFGSDDYLNERSELVAILLPSHNPPPAPMERVENELPAGPVPPPRNWVSPENERYLKSSRDYPWNAFN